ncbi:MAG: hypothetical protein A3I89_03290 [Candidatus Harrisonbacteria bacterium RIFCSPLOWO2_02_FULL_41_11]|uniref:Uncharacterized protein n=1 Tax=Candidatus Harrisonbacteria bacterium RIFCSPHIGHO2_02_FULL_42_16 TaxID=1798404 RepID=A0A1G1ZKM0_9BACT|nr:MAG: hypothetical protein A3B92_02780 [Candidatus Harrisonbacteria bacterium RIFCSPHIGHO2_02_FULL_42_16]OGY66262.1 MAG: hypothetical protein A3I89_03290 [Candidatus Harrisonbacteria bacterium RIFCSPLOWO2_02_FULL_41_11]
MLFKFPKDDKNFSWTNHVKNKMLQYRLSEQKIKTVLKNPARKEEGIAPKTTAVMKRNDTQKRKEEIWVMFRHANSAPPSRNAGLGNAKAPMRIKIISAWRYPGTSPKDKAIPIPEDILEELTGIL